MSVASAKRPVQDEIFLNDIPGESSDDGHADGIQVESWSWGMGAT
jgi:hypothetical protein